MKHRIKWLALLLAYLCFATACRDQELPPTDSEHAEVSSQIPLASRLEVPSSFQASYSSDSGISVITVDAKVVVPPVTSVDIVEAIPRAFTDEEIFMFIDRHSRGHGWTDVEARTPYNGHGLELDTVVNRSGLSLYRLWIKQEQPMYQHISAHCYLDTNSGQLASAPSLELISRYPYLTDDQLLPLTDGKAAGCKISLEEAMTFADAEAHAIAPDYEMTTYGQTPVWDVFQNPQFYAFRYTRHLNGIPVNDSHGGEICQNEYDYTSGLGVITLIVDDEGVCYISYHNPYDVGETIQTDCELLPFSQIMDIFSKVGLLSIQYLEHYEELQENTMEVYEIRFGYMAVRQPDNVDAYYYTPVWDFYARRTLFGTGGYSHGKDSDPIWGVAELTINAVDGTIIDRAYGY